ncbi:Endoglucanase [hydrothermal vent metagenome]|uniref:Endoglucanase n=1 Tax=hydrothermal vent metagenome TaxID=652676 RepID=A0A3B0RUD4_9ZZZZ
MGLFALGFSKGLSVIRLAMRILIPLILALAACVPDEAPAQAAAFPAKSCINLANALNAPNEGDWTYRIKKSHIEAVAKAGFDSIRVPIAWSEHTTKTAPYTIDPAFFTRVDEVVNQALSNGLMIILDVHNFEELDKNPTKETPRLRAIWRQIAWHYANAPETVVFELLNEPQDKMSGKRWENLLRELITDIRRNNQNRWLIVGGDNWNSLEGMAKLDAPFDPRLVLTFHDYEPYNFTHQGASWFDNPPPIGTKWGNKSQRADVKRRAAMAARVRDKTGMPVWLGEFGAHKRSPKQSRIEWTRAMREAMQANDIGWCAFDFGAEFAFWSEPTQSWNRPLLEALMGGKTELRR